MKKLLILGLLAAFALSGCHTIHFDNGPEAEKETRSELFSHWHHDGILQLVEFSDPEDMNHVCQQNEWTSVGVEQGFPQAIIAFFVGILYSPWDIQYTCAEG